MYKLIDLQYLASLINEILGSDFVVNVDSMTYLVNNKIECTLQAERVPFAVSNINSETLNITLTAYLNVDNNRIKSEQLGKLNKLVGIHQGLFDAFDEDGEAIKYRYLMQLNGNRPITDPAYDMGFDRASYQITGTALISNANEGGIVSNDIITEISNVPFESEEISEKDLAVISTEIDPGIVMENKFCMNDTRLYPLLQSTAKSFSFIVLRTYREVDNLIYNDILRCNFGGMYYLRRRLITDNSIDIVRVKLVAGKIVENPGAYAQYTVLFQEVE